MSLTPYLHLRQGDGGVYTMPVDIEDEEGIHDKMHWIGSHSCFTCVCIYIPISKDKVFAAHIDSHSGPKNTALDWITETEEVAKLLKTHIHKRLAEALPDLANGEYATNALRSRAIILCPRRELYLNATWKMHATGWAVVEAVREFFRFTPDSRGTEFAHGFLVNHSTGERHFLKWQSDAVNEDLQDRWDQLRRKAKDERVPRDYEELEEHGELLKNKKMPEEFGFSEVKVAEVPHVWTMSYDEESKIWGEWTR